MVTINFDKNCEGWIKNSEVCEYFLRIRYLNELLIARGYIYLNDVHENLGAKWNPDDDNICYRAENGPLDIRLEPAEDGAFLVTIN